MVTDTSMILQSFNEKYLITDSELLAVQIEYNSSSSLHPDTVAVKLKGRKALPNNKWELVSFTLMFEGATALYFDDTFECRTISQSTLVKIDSGLYYLSLDPFEEGQPSEKDNMLIKSRELYLLDEN